MSDLVRHRLIVLTLVVLLALALGLMFLEPLLGVLWLLLCLLACVIFAAVKPQIYRAEKVRCAQAAARLRERLLAMPQQEEPQIPPVYELAVIKPRAGERYAIDRKCYLIGRGSACSLRLTGSSALGREHCRIVYREHSREYYIEDLRSRNGTYLGTRRLEPHTQAKLLDGTEIFLGDYGLRFERKTGG